MLPVSKGISSRSSTYVHVAVASSIFIKIIEVRQKCYFNELGRNVISLARVTWIKKSYAISILGVAWNMKVCHRSG